MRDCWRKVPEQRRRREVPIEAGLFDVVVVDMRRGKEGKRIRTVKGGGKRRKRSAPKMTRRRDEYAP